MIETERLYLREMTDGDLDALYQVLGDADNMKHYRYAFEEKHLRIRR